LQLALVRIPARHPANKIGSDFLNPGGPGASGVDFALFFGPAAELFIYDGTTVLQRMDDLAWGNFTVGPSAENSFEFEDPPTVARPISLLFTITRRMQLRRVRPRISPPDLIEPPVPRRERAVSSPRSVVERRKRAPSSRWGSPSKRQRAEEPAR